MMKSLKEIAQALNSHTIKVREKVLNESLDALRKRLAKEEEIRVFVDRSPGSGHQSTTIFLLRRFIEEMKFQKKVTIVYRAESLDDEPTLNKLVRLLPEFNKDKPKDEFKIVADDVVATARLVEWNERNKLTRVSFGFTGGADLEEDNVDINYATELNVSAFLRCQPYKWPAPHHIQFYRRVCMSIDKELGEGYIERAFYVSKPADIKWDYYEKPGTHRKRTKNAFNWRGFCWIIWVICTLFRPTVYIPTYRGRMRFSPPCQLPS